MTIEHKEHPVKCGDVKVGDLMAFPYYGKVLQVNGQGSSVQVQGRTPGSPPEFGVNGAPLIEGAFSADQYHEEVTVSMTEAADILVSSFNVPLTVCFTKKDGNERVLRGRFLAEEPRLGYSHVEDLDLPEGDRLREVNHREILWLVVRGVKYTVGKKAKKK